MVHPSIIFQKSKGEIVNKKAMRQFFDQLEDCRYEATFKKLSKRSNSQNGYYWLMLTDFVQPALYHHGWREIKTKEDAHEFVGNLFLKVKWINQDSGEIMERVKSTRELTKGEFNEYLEEIWQWASEYLGVTIPAPNQQTIMSYE